MTTIEIDVDDRGRASLKSGGVAPGRYRLAALSSSAFKLDRVTSYTEAELLALSDPTIIEAHAAARKTPERYTPADDLP